jgi:hypothetical protein
LLGLLRMRRDLKVSRKGGRSSMYLIQGFFCQRHAGLGMGYVPEFGSVATIEEGVAQVMFAGFVQRDQATGRLDGEMLDPLGGSLLEEITIADDEVRFIKRYQNRRQRGGVAYVFRRGPLTGTWGGEYTLVTTRGKTVTGPARCVITEVDDTPFQMDIDRFTAKVRPQRELSQPEDDFGDVLEEEPDLGDPPF